jgi:outer membrane biosynthesis protein TonB
MDRGSIRILLSALGCAVIAAAAAHPGFAQRPNPAPDPAPAAPALSSQPTSQPAEPATEPKKARKTVPARAPKAEKPDRPEKKKQKVAPAAKRRAPPPSARSHQPDPGHAPVLAVAAKPTVAAVRSEGDTVPFSTKARVLLVGTVLLTLLLLAAAVAPRRLLVRLSVDGLQERRADLAFAGLCVLTVGSLLGTLVAISG